MSELESYSENLKFIFPNNEMFNKIRENINI